MLVSLQLIFSCYSIITNRNNVQSFNPTPNVVRVQRKIILGLENSIDDFALFSDHFDCGASNNIPTQSVLIISVEIQMIAETFA